MPASTVGTDAIKSQSGFCIARGQNDPAQTSPSGTIANGAMAIAWEGAAVVVAYPYTTSNTSKSTKSGWRRGT